MTATLSRHFHSLQETARHTCQEIGRFCNKVESAVYAFDKRIEDLTFKHLPPTAAKITMILFHSTPVALAWIVAPLVLPSPLFIGGVLAFAVLTAVKPNLMSTKQKMYFSYGTAISCAVDSIRLLATASTSICPPINIALSIISGGAALMCTLGANGHRRRLEAAGQFSRY